MADIKKKINGIITGFPDYNPRLGDINVIITNDEKGKTLTVFDNQKSFTFAFEEIEKYLK